MEKTIYVMGKSGFKVPDYFKDKTVYKYKDFKGNQKFYDAIMLAKITWQELADEYVLKSGGEEKLGGTCVGGAGFQVIMLYPRCRIPEYTTILRSPNYQSDSCYATNDILAKVRAILQEAGIECTYNSGGMR